MWAVNVPLVLRDLPQVTEDMVRHSQGECTQPSSNQKSAFQRHLRLGKGKQRAPTVKREFHSSSQENDTCVQAPGERIAFDIPLL